MSLKAGLKKALSSHLPVSPTAARLPAGLPHPMTSRRQNNTRHNLSVTVIHGLSVKNRVTTAIDLREGTP